MLDSRLDFQCICQTRHIGYINKVSVGSTCDSSLTTPLGPDPTSHLNRGSQAVMVTLDLKETG